MLDDPSLELRRDAVARLLAEAEKRWTTKTPRGHWPSITKLWAQQADLDQAQGITEALAEGLGHPVDLPSHYGFLQDWMLRRAVR